MNCRAFTRRANRTAFNRTNRVFRTLSLTVAAGSSVLLAACATSGGGSNFFVDPYVGIAAGVSELDLEIEGDAFSLSDSNDTALVLLGGATFNPHFGVELQLADLGEAVLDSGDAVGYQTFSASALGRVFGNQSGFELFGRLGVGALQNDEPSNPALLLETENSTSVVAGVGAEYRFTNGLGIRLEYVGHDSDAQFATLGVNYAFGGTRQRRSPVFAAPTPNRGSADIIVSREDQGVTVIDEGVTTIEEGVASGNEVITGQDLPDVGDRGNGGGLANEDISDAASTQLPAIRPLDTPAIPPVLPTPTLPTPNAPVPVSPPPLPTGPSNSGSLGTSPTPTPVTVPDVNTTGVPVREPVEDSDALLLQPLPEADSSGQSTNGSGNVGQFDVEETAGPQEIADADAPFSGSESTLDSTSAADPVIVPRQPEPNSGDDSDALAVDDIDFDGIADSVDDCSGTASGIPVNANGCDKYAGWLSGIGFLDSSSRLTGASRDSLDEIIADLQRFPDLILELQVEATSGSEADTFLARRRTIEILRFVRSQGIAGNRLKSLPPSSSSANNPNGASVFLRSLSAK